MELRSSRASAMQAAACALLLAAGCGAPEVSATAPRTQAAAVPPTTAPTHRALLIGIDEYSPAAESRRPAALEGAKLDVELATSILTGRFGFPPGSIRVLRDAEATHARVVREWKEWLIDAAGPATEVVFWYSGHGSRCPDAAGRSSHEVAGHDSTLTLYDSRVPPAISVDHGMTAKGGYDFTDDELHSLLRELARRTSRITVITDACHSGGVTRGGPRARFTGDFWRPLTRDDIADFWPAEVPFLEDGDPARAAPIPWVHLAACAFDQSAVEHVETLADGSRFAHGALTFFLGRTLQTAAPTATWRDVAARVALDVAWFHREQHVQAEGALDRALFGDGASCGARGLQAWIGPQSRAVEVDGGALHALAPGQELHLEHADGRAIARAILTEVAPTTALAQIEGDLPELAQVTPVRAVARGVGASRPLALAVATDPRLDAVAAALAQAPGVTVARLDRAAPMDAVDASAAALRLVPEPAGRGFSLEVAPSGPRLARFAAAPEEAVLRALLAVERRQRELLAQAQSEGAFHVAARLELLPEVAARRLAGGSPSAVRIAAADEIAADLVLQLDPAAVEAPLHLTVLLVAEDRTVTQLVPAADGARDAFLVPGEERRFSLLLTPTRLDGVERFGVDRLLVFATEAWFDTAPLLAIGADARPTTRSATTAARHGVAALDVQFVRAGREGDP